MSTHNVRRLPGMVVLTGLSLFYTHGFAQTLPENRIWLLPIEPGMVLEPLPVSPQSGYNNQPHFSADSRAIFFTAEQSEGQTDIWLYSLGNGGLVPITSTPESEYSPTPIPGQNALSVVRVEGEQRQRLWRIDLATGKSDVLLPDVEPVGYHAWVNESSVALFLLGEAFTLHLAQPGSEGSRQVHSGIGRTLRKDPGLSRVLFVDKTREPWEIRSIDPESGESKSLLALFPGSEDFEVGPDGVFWTGNGSKLYRAEPGAHWRLAADLTEYGVKNISRIAASPDGRWLALVGGP